MKLEGHQRRLTIFIRESDRHGHPARHRDRATRPQGRARRRVGLPWCGGYGASNHIHTTRIRSLSDDLPIAVIIIDTEERIPALLPGLDEVDNEGLVIIDDVEVLECVGRPGGHG